MEEKKNPFASLSDKELEAMLKRLEDSNERQASYAKKQYRMSQITALASILILAIVKMCIRDRIKKQLARRVEVIKVVDLTETAAHCEELMFLRIHDCSEEEIRELFRMASVFHARVIDYSPSSILLKSVRPEEENTLLIKRMKKRFPKRIYAIRGGSVAIPALSPMD